MVTAILINKQNCFFFFILYLIKTHITGALFGGEEKVVEKALLQFLLGASVQSFHVLLACARSSPVITVSPNSPKFCFKGLLVHHNQNVEVYVSDAAEMLFVFPE